MSVSVPLRLRPLEIGDMLDETFRMYRRHFLLFAGISLLLAIPSAALYGLAFAWFSVALRDTTGTDLSYLTPLIATAGAGFLVTLAILPFTNSAVMYAACESALGRPVTLGGVFFGILRRYFPLLGYWLLFTITGGLAALLCLVPPLASLSHAWYCSIAVLNGYGLARLVAPGVPVPCEPYSLAAPT